jgi:hypothetical protein
MHGKLRYIRVLTNLSTDLQVPRLEDTPKERRHLSHLALVDSAIRSSKQLAASGDILARSLGNRLFSDLTQLRRQMPHRRSNENPLDLASTASASRTPQAKSASNAAIVEVVPPQKTDAEHTVAPTLAPAAEAKTATPPHSWDEHIAIRDAIDNDATQYQAIIDLHRNRTVQRLKTHAMVLCMYGEWIVELGAVAAAASGETHIPASMAVKAILGVTPQQEPLGLIEVWIAENDATGNALRAYEQVADTRAKSPASRFLLIAELRFELARFTQRIQKLGTPADWLVNIPADSALYDDASVWGRVLADAELGDKSFTLAPDNDHMSHEIRVRLWSKRMEIQIGSDKVWATCFIAREIDDEATEKSADSLCEWHLLSNRNAPDLASTGELFEYWLAFDPFNHLTQRTQVAIHNDDTAVHSTPPLPADLNIKLALNLITTCRIAQLIWHLQATPEIGAGLFFTDQELRAIELLTRQQTSKETQLAQIMRLLVKLGGGGNSTEASDPSFEALRRGLQRLSDAAAVLRRLV